LREERNPHLDEGGFTVGDAAERGREKRGAEMGCIQERGKGERNGCTGLITGTHIILSHKMTRK